jgi:hypothetical protein
MRCQNSKSGQYRLTSGSKLIEQEALSHTRNLLCWPADIHSVTRSSRHPARRGVKQRSRGRNLQREQKWRRLADVNFYRKFIWVFNKNPYIWGKPVIGVEPGRATSLQNFKTWCKRWFVFHSTYSRNTQFYIGVHTKCLKRIYNNFLPYTSFSSITAFGFFKFIINF